MRKSMTEAEQPSQPEPGPEPTEARRPRRRRRKRKQPKPVEASLDAAQPDEPEDVEEPPKAKAPAKVKEPAARPREPKEKEPARPKDSAKQVEARPFGDLTLSPVMLQALAKAEYLEPTPVQAGMIPRALAGVDVMAQARTGTGKTAAFAIPILEQVDATRHPGEPQALILAPTRELAVQVRDELMKLAANRHVQIVALYGGKPLAKQAQDLHRGPHVIVGTPGRVLDHMGRHNLSLARLRWVVLDEADRMLDIGFRPDIEKILRQAPGGRQTLLLSATIPPPVRRLAERYMHNPEMLDFSPTDIAVETIEQFYFTVVPEKKFDLLVRLVEREQPRQAIVFCRTRRGTEKVGQRLNKKAADVAAIHGDLAQKVRDRVMQAFREGKVRYLVATDVVGRGIDVSGISHIINYDIPQFSDDYVHRVGRTGRMGREGVAYTFVTPEEGNELTRIEMRIDRLLTRDEIPGFDAVSHDRLAGVPTGTPSGAAGTPPDAAGEPAPPAEPPERKEVFGRRVRRIRRAL
jgi:ATP-dependent RNA helicase DeaD